MRTADVGARGAATGHKYHARRTEYEGEVYDSMAEATYARDLDLRMAAGEVAYWHRPAQIVLVPGTRDQRITYRPDFYVVYSDGRAEHIDVKGAETEAFRLRIKLYKRFGPKVPLRIVGKKGERVV